MTPSPYGPLLIDRRVGSSDLYPLLQRVGVQVELTTLPFGDAAFLGRGEHDTPTPIGIERKRLGDLVSSLMGGRLNGHQLPGLLAAYRFTWIIVEGDWRRDAHGTLLVPRRGGWKPLEAGRTRFRWDSLASWLLTVSLRGGARLLFTRDADDTAAWIATLYAWWTSKPWQDHRGHLALDEAIPEHDAMMLIPPTVVARVAAQLPGIGYEKARAVGAHFPTVLSMACAGLSEWRQIDGIGDGIGRRVVKLIQEGGRA